LSPGCVAWLSPLAGVAGVVVCLRTWTTRSLSCAHPQVLGQLDTLVKDWVRRVSAAKGMTDPDVLAEVRRAPSQGGWLTATLGKGACRGARGPACGLTPACATCAPTRR
jgi:hypothetical protein